MGFPSQEHWSELPFPPPGDLSTQGSNLHLLHWQVGSLLLLLSRFSHVQLCETLWTVAHRAPVSIGFSGQEYWDGLPCPPPGDLSDPEMEPKSPALASGFFTSESPGNHLG